MDNQDDYKVKPSKQEIDNENKISNSNGNKIDFKCDEKTINTKDYNKTQSFSKEGINEKKNINENSICDVEKNCTVHLLNGGKFECSITPKTTGKDVFRQTCDYLILREHEYFGLTYRDLENVRIWVNLDKKISKVIKENPNSLHFEVKFFPEPTDLKENITRFFLCLQIRNNILEEKILCSEEAYAVLGSYLVQSEMGNHDPEKHKEDYLNEFKFAPNPSESLIKRLAELHKERKGLTAPESELAFLQNAKNYSIYGLDFYAAKDSNDSQITIGVCSSGLSVYKKNNCIEKFPWLKIMKISYNLEKFYIKVKPSEKTENLIGFNLSSAKAAKDLWKITVDHHTFFKSFLTGSNSNKHSKKLSSSEEKKSKHHHKSSSSNNLKSNKSNKVHHSKHKDNEKSEKEVAKINNDKHKNAIEIKSSSNKLDKNRHYQDEKTHYSSSRHKRKKESESAHHSYHHHHHQKDHYSHHHEESKSKDRKNKDSVSKSILSLSKNKKHKHKHKEESDKKASSESRHRSENKEKTKSPSKNKDEKSKISCHDYKKHKHKKSKKSVENKLSFSPLVNESLVKQNIQEKSFNNNTKKVSSHYIKDLISMEAEKKSDVQLRTQTESKEKANFENSSKKESINSDFSNKENSYNIQTKTISSPKKDMKLFSKSDIEFDIFWNNGNNEESSKNEVSKSKDSKDANKNDSQNSNNKDEKIFIPRVLLNGSSTSKSNKLFNNNQDENQNKKGPKTPPYEDIDAYENSMSNQSLPTPTQDESQNAINEKFNNSFSDSNVNSIKSLSPSSQHDSNSQQNLSSKNQLSNMIHYSNSNKASKNDIYDPEAPLESPESSPCQKNNSNSRHTKNSQKNTFDSSNLQSFSSYNSKSKTNGENISADMEIDSPFSSSAKSPNPKKLNSNNCLTGLQSSITAPALKTVLDHLIKVAQMQQKNQNSSKNQQSTFKKPAPVHSINSGDQSYFKNDNLDEIPSSAVDMNSREKYIKKLNRQERVIEELKCSLKPFYQKREINKEEYKEIMRKAVPKICHSKTGEINPIKIKHLVKNYINKAKHARKNEKS